MTQEQHEQCWEQLKAYAPKSIAWNHYDLAANTDINDVELWKEFLQTRVVIEWLSEERAMLQQYEQAKLTMNVANSRSTGQAQLIAAMEKVNQANRDAAAQGTAFIYTYIPLNAQQRHAPNVQELTEDIFYVMPEEFQFDSEAPTLPT